MEGENVLGSRLERAVRTHCKHLEGGEHGVALGRPSQLWRWVFVVLQVEAIYRRRS